MTDTAGTGSGGGYDTCASVAKKEVCGFWSSPHKQPTQTKRAHSLLASAAGSSFRAWPYRLMAAVMVLLRSLRCYPKLPEGSRGQRQLHVCSRCGFPEAGGWCIAKARPLSSAEQAGYRAIHKHVCDSSLSTLRTEWTCTADSVAHSSSSWLNEAALLFDLFYLAVFIDKNL